MVRRRSTVRFRKGAPQVRGYLRNFLRYSVLFCTLHAARMGAKWSSGGLGVDSVGSQYRQACAALQQFRSSADPGDRAARTCYVCATIDLGSQGARERPDRIFVLPFPRRWAGSEVQNSQLWRRLAWHDVGHGLGLSLASPSRWQATLGLHSSRRWLPGVRPVGRPPRRSPSPRCQSACKAAPSAARAPRLAGSSAPITADLGASRHVSVRRLGRYRCAFLVVRF